MKVELIPYGTVESSESIAVTGNAERSGNALSLEFELKGNLSAIFIPSSQAMAARHDELWKRTCFEAFFTWEEQPFYWELNVSPSGSWNLYYFDNYRTGQIREERVKEIVYETLESSSGVHRSKIVLDLAQILPRDPKVMLSLGLTAVIERQDHTKTYWAIEHFGVKPDFHIRKSFSLRI